MSNSWQRVYTKLTDFIDEHSEVKIGASSVRIPENAHTEFYRLFNIVRTAFVEGKFPDLLVEANLLSQNYLKAEKQVTALLGLDDVSMVAKLSRFLNDPIDGLRGGLFDPLFDLLKGKVGVETFEERASRNIEASFRPLYRLGYEKWVVLSLVKLLKADKLLQVATREFAYDEEKAMMEGGTSFEEDVPPPEESRRLSFKHKQEAVFIVPDFIVHSTKINRYVSVRSEYGAAIARASNTSDKREWYPLDSVVALEPDFTLIYMADNPKEISLVADAKKICRPEFIIECREQKDWYEKEGLEKVKLYHDNLKPRLGTYIVSREPEPEQAFKETTPEMKPEEQEEDIHILTIGFDPSKLTPIIDAFKL